MLQPIVRAENISKIYRTGAEKITVIAGASFEVRAGESVALVGESGAGKTTLLHLLGALDLSTSGEIYVEGKPFSAYDEAELAALRNRRIGYVWQSYHLLPEFTALENVMMPLLIGGTEHAEAEGYARRWLGEVGLADRATHQAGELSGGEQQRVAIARALVASPKLVLADEPTGNLDEDTAEAIIRLIVSLPSSHEVAAVIATHNLALARRCDRIFRIEHGEVRQVHGMGLGTAGHQAG